MNSCVIAAPSASVTSELAALQNQIERSPYWSIRQLRCEWDQQRVVLRGTVPSYYIKQLAQSLAGKVIGVGRIHLEIEVGTW